MASHPAHPTARRKKAFIKVLSGEEWERALLSDVLRGEWAAVNGMGLDSGLFGKEYDAMTYREIFRSFYFSRLDLPMLHRLSVLNKKPRRELVPWSVVKLAAFAYMSLGRYALLGHQIVGC